MRGRAGRIDARSPCPCTPKYSQTLAGRPLIIRVRPMQPLNASSGGGGENPRKDYLLTIGWEGTDGDGGMLGVTV